MSDMNKNDSRWEAARRLERMIAEVDGHGDFLEMCEQVSSNSFVEDLEVFDYPTIKV